MTSTTYTRQQDQVQTSEQSGSNVAAELDKVIIGSIAAFTGIIGLWSFACLTSALYQAGGPIQLAVGYFKAVAGL